MGRPRLKAYYARFETCSILDVTDCCSEWGESSYVAFRHHEYEMLTVLEAGAVGEPGQRRFHLIAGTSGDVVTLWMEKEQLQALGLAIDQLITQLNDAGLTTTEIVAEPAPLGEALSPTMPEYLVSKMAIGYDDERQLVAVFAHDAEQEDEDEPVFSGRAALPAAKALAEQITEVVAAGRPRCPRCGQPIGPEGHVCPHDNGHLPWIPE